MGIMQKPRTISSQPVGKKMKFSSQVPRCHALPLQEMEKRALTGEAALEIKTSVQINVCFFTEDMRCQRWPDSLIRLSAQVRWCQPRPFKKGNYVLWLHGLFFTCLCVVSKLGEKPGEQRWLIYSVIWTVAPQVMECKDKFNKPHHGFWMNYTNCWQ